METIGGKLPKKDLSLKTLILELRIMLSSVALFPYDRKYDMSWLYVAFPSLSPGCRSLRVNPAWTYSFVLIMRTRGTEERILPAQFEGSVETGQKGKLFFLVSQIADSGRWDLPCTQPSINYAVTGNLIPKVHFLLKGRGLGLAICYNLAPLPLALSSRTQPPLAAW